MLMFVWLVSLVILFFSSVLSYLHHPNIVQCVGQCVETMPYLLVFELCELVSYLQLYLICKLIIGISLNAVQRPAIFI